MDDKPGLTEKELFWSEAFKTLGKELYEWGKLLRKFAVFCIYVVIKKLKGDRNG